MPWIFGSFPVTPYALTSCPVVISKQDSTIRALGSNRCVTRRRPRDKNHAVRLHKIAVEPGTRIPSETSLTSLQGDAMLRVHYQPNLLILDKRKYISKEMAQNKTIPTLVLIWHSYRVAINNSSLIVSWFKCIQTNKECKIVSVTLHSNTWNHLTVC